MGDKKKIKRIGVLTSGGDAPGMNAAIRAVVRASITNGVQCVGIYRGYEGLLGHSQLGKDFRVLQGIDVSHILSRGGTMLYTARSEVFRTKEGQQHAAQTCNLLGLDGVITIGGDGTFQGALALSKQGIPVIGIPGTIDNDIGCTHYTIGFDTACNTAVECIDKLRDTMQSHERCSVVEVMGRHAGYLALYVGLAVGANAVLLPERKDEFDIEKDLFIPMEEARLAGNTHFIVVVAEGAGSAFEIGKDIEKKMGMKPRVTVLGHIQRGGVPTVRDRETASLMGYKAVEALVQGRHNLVVGTWNGQLNETPLEEAVTKKKPFPMQRYEIMMALQNRLAK